MQIEAYTQTWIILHTGLGARSKFKNLLQNLILIAIYLYSSFVNKQCCCRNTGNRVLHPG